MSGLFENIEMFDESDKVATRQAIAVANKRFNDKFAGFLRQASTKKEFESRLALVDTDINNMVADVANEYGGDAEKIAAAIKDAAAMTHIATCDCDGKCEGMCKCGGCDSCKCDSKKTANGYDPYSEDPAWDKAVELFIYKYGTRGDTEENARYHINEQKDQILQQVRNPQNVQEVLNAIARTFGIESQHDPYDDGDELNNPSTDKFSKNEERPERLKAQDEIQLADEHSQVPPWLTKQKDGEDQEDGGNRKGSFLSEGSSRAGASNPIDSYTNLQDAGEIGVDVGPGSTGQNLVEAVGDVGSAIGNAATLHPIKAVGDLASGVGNVVESVPVVGDIAHAVFGSTQHEAISVTDVLDTAHSLVNPSSIPLKKLNEETGNFLTRDTDLYEDLDKPVEEDPVYTSKNVTAAMERALELKHRQSQMGISSPEFNEAMPEGISSESPASSMMMGQLGVDSESAASSAGNLVENVTDQLRGGIDSKQMDQFLSKNDNWVNEGDTVTDDGKEKRVEDIEQAGSEKVVKLDDGSTEDIDDVKKSRVAADVETGDKTEERESLPKGDEDALGGPSPKIDKKKWVPNATNPDGNLKPIDTEGENSPVPTRHMDIKEDPNYQQDTFENLVKYDNNVWERQDLPSADDNAGFNTERNISQDGQSGTFPNKGQAKPVTREALAAMDRTASFRVFLNEIGMSQADFRNATDAQKSRLWDIYNNYDMPKYTEEEGLNVPLTEEAPMEDNLVEINEETGVDGEINEPPIEEQVIIEATPDDVEQIIEREDKEGDRVTVKDEGDEDIDLIDDKDLSELDDLEESFEEIDPNEFVEGPSDEELEALIRDMEENPDDWQ